MTDVLILGPVAVRARTTTTTPSSALLRRIIGVLAIAGDAGMSVPTLADSAWPGHHGQVGAKALVVAVHRTRHWLAQHTDGEVRIEHTTKGYVLHGAEIDAHRFGRLVERADSLAEALALWRGEPLADVVTGAGVAPAIEALCRARLAATVQYGLALLAAGRPDDSVAAVTPLAGAYPLDEPLHAVLVEALAMAGRQAEALEVYERLRLRLADELGVAPSRALSGTLVRVLRQETPVTTTESAAPERVPAQLPAGLGVFTGRLDQLAQLGELAATTTGGSVVITAPAGIGGVGKTTLAVHWSHEAGPDFPDGQLYIDLRGYARGEPVSSVGALGRFLRALGIAAERVPRDVGEAAALYRTVLTGRRVLVVLDNAVSAEQVRPLLPNVPGCLALVTSRDRMDGLVAWEGAGRLRLDVFRPDESIDLLAALLGAERIAGDPDAARELAELCGHLPLAVHIVGAQLAGSPGLPIAEQVRALWSDRCTEPAEVGEPMAAMRAVLDLCFAQLSDVDRRVFRLLGVMPGTDISRSAVAMLGGPASEAALDRLVSAHLVRYDGARYSLHDLVRDYARQRAADEPDRTAAIDRLCYWNLGSADAAARLLYSTEPRLPLPPVALAERLEFADTAVAQEWLRAELYQLHVRRPVRDGISDDRELLAQVLVEIGDLPGAADLLLESIDHAERHGLTTREMAATNTIAHVYLAMGEINRATDHFRRVLPYYRQVSDASIVVPTLDGYARALRELGRPHEALVTLDEAAARNDARGDEGNQFLVHVHRATVNIDLGRYEGVRDFDTDRLAVARSQHRERYVAIGQYVVGLAELRQGRPAAAIDSFRTVTTLARLLGLLSKEIDGLIGWAEAAHSLHDDTGALAHAQTALALADRSGYRLCEARALGVLAQVHLTRGQSGLAAALAERALMICKAGGGRLAEARVLRLLGDIRDAQGHAETAAVLWHTARARCADMGTPYPPP